MGRKSVTGEWLDVGKTVELPWRGKGGKEVYWNAIITEGNYILHVLV